MFRHSGILAQFLFNCICFLFTDGITLSNEDLIYEIVIATGSDFGVYSWEGFEFETGNAPKEECKLIFFY